MRTRRLAKERLVNAGTVIGMDEQLLQAPYQCTYVTASFVHVFFFDKAQVRAEIRGGGRGRRRRMLRLQGVCTAAGRCIEKFWCTFMLV